MFVPCSGLTGENLVGPCEEPLLLKWYNGPSLLDRIGTSGALPFPLKLYNHYSNCNIQCTNRFLTKLDVVKQN